MADYDAELILNREGLSNAVQFKGGIVPGRFAVRLSGGDIIGEVTLQLRMDEHGPRIEAYTHRAPPGGFIDAEGQRLPLGRLREAAVYNAILSPTSIPVTGVAVPVRLAGSIEFSVPPRHRLDDDHFREVARIHAEGGRRGTAAVAEAFSVARATASRWVAEARKRFPADTEPVRPKPTRKGRTK